MTKRVTGSLPGGRSDNPLVERRHAAMTPCAPLTERRARHENMGRGHRLTGDERHHSGPGGLRPQRRGTGERVVMLSGLSFVPPDTAGAVLRTWRDGYSEGPRRGLRRRPAARPPRPGPARPAGSRRWIEASCPNRRSPPPATSSQRASGSSLEVRWDAGSESSCIIRTRLRRRRVGFVSRKATPTCGAMPRPRAGRGALYGGSSRSRGCRPPTAGSGERGLSAAGAAAAARTCARP